MDRPPHETGLDLVAEAKDIVSGLLSEAGPDEDFNPLLLAHTHDTDRDRHGLIVIEVPELSTEGAKVQGLNRICSSIGLLDPVEVALVNLAWLWAAPVNEPVRPGDEHKRKEIVVISHVVRGEPSPGTGHIGTGIHAGVIRQADAPPSLTEWNTLSGSPQGSFIDAIESGFSLAANMSDDSREGLDEAILAVDRDGDQRMLHILLHGFNSAFETIVARQLAERDLLDQYANPN